MPKRRRERDRPKAANDALYNPNKRVLLSYASDEEVEDAAQQTADIGADARVLEAATSVESPRKEDTTIDITSRQSPARRELLEETWHEDPDAEEVEQEEEQAVNDASLWLRSTTKNPATGQWATLGSLSYQWEEDEYDEEDEEYDSTEEEAMSYLRAVR